MAREGSAGFGGRLGLELDEVQAAKGFTWPLLFDILAADRSIYSLQNLVGTRLATAKLYAEAPAQGPTASTRSVRTLDCWSKFCREEPSDETVGASSWGTWIIG